VRSKGVKRSQGRGRLPALSRRTVTTTTRTRNPEVKVERVTRESVVQTNLTMALQARTNQASKRKLKTRRLRKTQTERTVRKTVMQTDQMAAQPARARTQAVGGNAKAKMAMEAVVEENDVVGKGNDEERTTRTEVKARPAMHLLGSEVVVRRAKGVPVITKEAPE